MSGLLAKGLKKSFNNRTVVKNVCLYLKRGEVVGLLGPNGAGKTTTFYMLAGIEMPESGMIAVDDKEITRFRLYKRARLGIAFLPQHRSLFAGLTVRANIVAVLQLKGYSDEECEQRTQHLLEEYHLIEQAEQKASTLSGGEARRLEIARALAIGPLYILLDEPFAGIDPITVNMVQDLVTSLADKGIGILISDHNVRETLKICHRAYIMHQGEIKAEGPVDHLVSNELVKRVYIGEDFRL